MFRNNSRIYFQVTPIAQRLILFLQRVQIQATYDVLIQVTREMAKERVLHRMWKTNEQNITENQKLAELIVQKEGILEYEETAKREAREAHERDIAKLTASNSNEISAKL